MIIDIIFCVISLIILILGIKKGLIGFLLGIVITVGILVGSFFLTPLISDSLVDTSIGQTIVQKLDSKFQGDGEIATLLQAPITQEETEPDASGETKYVYYVTFEGDSTKYTLEEALSNSFSTIKSIPAVGPALLTTVCNYAEKMLNENSGEVAEAESFSLSMVVERKLASLLIGVVVFVLLVLVFMIIRKIIRKILFKKVEAYKVLNTIDHLLGLVVGVVIVLAIGFGLTFAVDYVNYKDMGFGDVLAEQVLGGVILPVLHENNPLNGILNVPVYKGEAQQEEETEQQTPDAETRVPSAEEEELTQNSCFYCIVY